MHTIFLDNFKRTLHALSACDFSKTYSYTYTQVKSNAKKKSRHGKYLLWLVTSSRYSFSCGFACASMVRFFSLPLFGCAVVVVIADDGVNYSRMQALNCQTHHIDKWKTSICLPSGNVYWFHVPSPFSHRKGRERDRKKKLLHLEVCTMWMFNFPTLRQIYFILQLLIKYELSATGKKIILKFCARYKFYFVIFAARSCNMNYIVRDYESPLH